MSGLVTHLECARISDTDEMKYAVGIGRFRNRECGLRRGAKRNLLSHHVDCSVLSQMSRLKGCALLLIDAFTSVRYRLRIVERGGHCFRLDCKGVASVVLIIVPFPIFVNSTSVGAPLEDQSVSPILRWSRHGMRCACFTLAMCFLPQSRLARMGRHERLPESRKKFSREGCSRRFRDLFEPGALTSCFRGLHCAPAPASGAPGSAARAQARPVWLPA
jgi:hypothetical protein